MDVNNHKFALNFASDISSVECVEDLLLYYTGCNFKVMVVGEDIYHNCDSFLINHKNSTISFYLTGDHMGIDVPYREFMLEVNLGVELM